MMIVIFGTRFYGEVDSHGGESQVTNFFHIYYLPLLPLETLWMTQDVTHGRYGHAVASGVRSVVAGYTRVWGPLLALISLGTGNIGATIASGVLVGLAAWSWRWRSVRGKRERRRSDYHLLAFGSRCDPLNMETQFASMLQADVAEQWARVADGRTPEDVARLGAASPTQAVLAYASLRLAARLAPSAQARKARDASERLLDALKDPGSALEGGPYRAAAPLPGRGITGPE